MKKFLILFLLLVFISPVLAANWVEVEDKLYVDVSSIEQYEKYYTSMWVKQLNDGFQLFKNIEKDYNKKVWYTLEMFIFDCSSKKLGTRKMISYDTSDDVVESVDLDFAPNSPIVPESYGELYYNIACRVAVADTQNNDNSSRNVNKVPGFKVRTHR